MNQLHRLLLVAIFLTLAQHSAFAQRPLSANASITGGGGGGVFSSYTTATTTPTTATSTTPATTTSFPTATLQSMLRRVAGNPGANDNLGGVYQLPRGKGNVGLGSGGINALRGRSSPNSITASQINAASAIDTGESYPPYPQHPPPHGRPQIPRGRPANPIRQLSALNEMHRNKSQEPPRVHWDRQSYQQDPDPQHYTPAQNPMMQLQQKMYNDVSTFYYLFMDIRIRKDYIKSLTIHRKMISCDCGIIDIFESVLPL